MNAPSQIPLRDRKRGRFVRVLLALCAAAAFVFFAAPAERAMAQMGPTTPVNIPDLVLRAKLEGALGKASGAPITRAEMAALGGSRGYLDLNRAYADRNNPALAIRDLTGLEYATGLRLLFFGRNEISDLSPLAGLTLLQTLSLPYNQVSDLGPLAGLPNLSVVSLQFNRISDLRPLAGLTSLTVLNLYSNRISDLTPLARLTRLIRLVISDNPVSDLTPLAGLSLERLFANTARITDLSPLRNMHSLTYLTLSGNQDLKDLSPLSGLPRLWRLSVDATAIEDLSPLVASSAFTAANSQIDLRYNRLDDDAIGQAQTLRSRGIRVLPLGDLRNGLSVDPVVRMLPLIPGVRELKVVWKPLTDYNPKGYEVWWKTGAQAFLGCRTPAAPPRHKVVIGAGMTTYTIPDLPPVEHSVVVQAYQGGLPPSCPNQPGPRQPRGSAELGTPYAVGKVRGRDGAVTVVPAVESLVVSWDPVDGANGYKVQWRSGEQGYDEEECPPSTNARQICADGKGTTSVTIPDLEPGTRYTIRVIATTAAGPDGLPSDEATGTPLPGELSRVTGVKVEPGVKSLVVSWDPVDGANGYPVQWRSGEQGYDKKECSLSPPNTRQGYADGADTTSYTIRGLIPDVEYKVRVCAIADNRTGEFSVEKPGRPLPDPVEQSRVLGMVLAGVGRTLATDAVEILAARSGTPVSRLHVTLDGQVLRLTDPPGWDSSPSPDHPSPPEGVTSDGSLPPSGVAGGGSPSPLAGEGRGEGAASPVTPGASPWQRVTGVAVGVARALGVAVDVPSPLTREARGEGRLPPRQGAQSIPTRFPAGALRRSTGQSPLRINPVSVKELLARSAFDLPLTSTGKDGVPAWTLWGRGAASGFSGQPRDDFTMTGNLYSGYVGVDYRPKPAMLLGLAVAHSTGNVDYTLTGSSNAAVDVEITSILPYAHWQPTPSLGVWSMVGAGWGDMAVETVESAGMRRTTDLSFWMGAVGGRQALTTWQGIDVAAKTDAFLTTVKSDGKVNLAAARGQAQRMRLLMEGRTAVDLSPVSQVQPRLEVGGRWDSGTAEQGLGLELGGGLAYTQTAWGLSVNAQGRYLLAHKDGDFEDWGASLNLRLDPGDRGQGAWLTVTPVWGRAASGTQQLWENAMVLESVGDGTRTAASGIQPQRLDVDIGYGVAMAGSTRTVTPYGGLAMTGPGTSRYRLGGRVDLLLLQMGLNVEGERANQPGRSASHGVSVNFDWQW